MRCYALLVLLLLPCLNRAQNCGSCQIVGRFCYAFNSNAVSNGAAISQCNAAGGRLPFFSTAQDLNDFASFCQSKGLGASWMGYWNYGPHSPGSPGLWVDQKGNIGSAMNWAGGEPNDSGGNEPCVQTYPGGSWNDISCGAWYQVVCQCECPMPSGPNLIVSGGVPPAVNSVITITCATCYYITGATTATCVYTGSTVVWDQTVSNTYCTRYQCSDIFDTTGTLSSGTFSSCTSYDFTCNTNSLVVSRNVVVDSYACSSTGTWDKAFIPCIMTCPVISTIIYGVVTPNSFANVLGRPINGTVINFSCNTCYELIGSAQLTCKSDGTWNYPAPICQRIKCPAMFTATTGTPAPTPYLACISYNYTCNPDYIVDPRNAIIDTYYCGALGVWNKPFIPCVITCPVLPNVGKVYVTQGTSANLLNRPNVDTVATFECASAWTLQGPNNATCLSDGTWSNGYPSCNRSGSACDNIFDTTIGTVSSSGPYLLGVKYNFTCKTNMIIWPANAVYETYFCQLDTDWDKQFTSCIMTCPTINTMPNGTVNQDTIPNVLGRPIVGSIVNFTCNLGYFQIGSSSSVCQTDGTWSSAVPTCDRSKCSDIFSNIGTATGTVAATILLSNTIYTFTCNPLYYLANKNTIAQDYICQSNATWNLPFEPCVPVCQEITNLANGKASGGGQNTAAVNGVSSGTQVVFSCNTGYYLVGSKTSTCQADGSWSDPTPYCSATRCPFIFDQTGEIDAIEFFPTTFYYFSCKPNSFVKGSMNSGTEYYCEKTGDWKPKFVSCSFACEAVTTFYHGKVSYEKLFESETLFAGTKAFFTCDTGYSLNGVSMTVCNESGLWSDPMPNCAIGICKDIWTDTPGVWTPEPPFYSLQNVEYKCPKDTIADLPSNLNLQCDIYGNWDRSLAICEKTCEVPNLSINNGRISFPINNRVVFGDRVMQNSTITVSCDKGFTVTSPSFVICSSTGNWTSEMPKCMKNSVYQWWWPILLALAIALAVSLGVCLHLATSKKRKTMQYAGIPIQINQIYHG